MGRVKNVLRTKFIGDSKIVDSVDKLHFIEPVEIPFVLEDNLYKQNYNFKSKAVVDLSQSNYFILNTENVDPEDWTCTINICFINYKNVQRFEILVVNSETPYIIDWERDHQDVCFPFSFPVEERLESSIYEKQRIITFRLGNSVVGPEGGSLQQFIGVATPWFSSVLHLNVKINPYSTPITENAVCYPVAFFEEEDDFIVNEEFVDPELNVSFPLSSNRPASSQDFDLEEFDGNGFFFFNLMRGYKYAVHVINFGTNNPSFTKILSENILTDHIEKEYNITQNTPSNFVFYPIQIYWHEDAEGTMDVTFNIEKGGSTFIKTYTIPFDLYQNLENTSAFETHVKTPFNEDNPFGSLKITHVFYEQWWSGYKSGEEEEEYGDTGATGPVEEWDDVFGTTRIEFAISQSYKETDGFVLQSVGVQLNSEQYAIVNPTSVYHIGDFCVLDYLNKNDLLGYTKFK